MSRRQTTGAEDGAGISLDGPSVDECGGDGDDSGNATATRAEPVAPRRIPSAVHASHGYTWVPIEDLRQAEAEANEQAHNALVYGLRPVILDSFCGQGGAGMGFYHAGFEVVGIDIVSQPRYPFEFIQGDAIELIPALLATGRFAAAHASCPCQGYSDTQRIRGREHPKLIAQTRELLIASGLPYVIENVPGARAELRDPVMLCGAMFPELRVYRHRYFETSFPVTVPPHPEHIAPQVKMGRPPQPGEFIQCVGNFSGAAYGREAMGMPWATREGLREAIPPAFTRLIGHQLMAEVLRRRESERRAA